MDPILYIKIQNKLRAFLKREPLEKEIVNGQNDSILMGWIRDDEAQTQAVDIKNLKDKVKI